VNIKEKWYTTSDMTWLEDFLASNDLALLLRWRRHCWEEFCGGSAEGFNE